MQNIFIPKKANPRLTLDYTKLQEESMLNKYEVAEYLGISVNTVIKYYQKEKKIKYYKIGKKVVFQFKDVKEFLEDAKRTSVYDTESIDINNLNDDSLLTVKDVAVILKMSMDVVRRLYLKNGIPYFKIGRRIRFKYSDIKQYINTCYVPKQEDKEEEAMQQNWIS